MRNGILIDYEYCTGCGTCEVAGKMEHDIPVGKWCIRILETGPWEIAPKEYEYNFIPYPTDMCDLCESRVKKGKLPTCVHHCLGQCLTFGPIDELVKKLDSKSKQALFVPGVRNKV